MNSVHQRFKVISHMIMIMKGIYSFTQKKKKRDGSGTHKKERTPRLHPNGEASQKRTSICIVHIPLFDS